MNNLVKRLRNNADIDEAEGCTSSVVALEREAADRIEQLEAELAEAKKDGLEAKQDQARYRYLRDMKPVDFGNMPVNYTDFDRQVDAAIKDQQ